MSDLLVKRRRITGKTGGGPPVIAGRPEKPAEPAARAARGRFAKGASGNPQGRYAKGRSGNPKGRPRGSSRFRAGTRAASALLDAHAEFIAEQAIELVRAGDAVAVRFCLGRILGVRRGQPVELELPAVAGAGDLTGAVTAITAALADGRLTPDEALALSHMLDGFPRVLAAGRAASPADEVTGDDVRETLRRNLARLARAQALAPAEAAEASAD